MESQKLCFVSYVQCSSEDGNMLIIKLFLNVSLQILENERANNFLATVQKDPDSITLSSNAAVATKDYKNIPAAEPHKSGCC